MIKIKKIHIHIHEMIMNSLGLRPRACEILVISLAQYFCFPNRAKLGAPPGPRRPKMVPCSRVGCGSECGQVMATCNLQWNLNVVSGFIDPAMRF